MNGSSSTSLLLEACGRGELEVVKDLVERHGVNVNATATYTATYSKGPSVKTVLTYSASPLFVAAGNCNLEITRYLVDKGANVHSSTGLIGHEIGPGLSPVHAAILLRPDTPWSQKKATIEFLFDNGADPSAFTDGSPIRSLCIRGEPALTMLLIELFMSLTRWSLRTANDVLLHHEELARITKGTRLAGELDKAESKWPDSAGDEDFVPVFDLLIGKCFDIKGHLYNCGMAVHNFIAMPVLQWSADSHSSRNIGDDVDELRDLFLERAEISPLEKVDALELAGAMSLLHHREEDISVSKAFQYWNAAVDLRESAQGSIPKVPLEDNNIVPWRTIEWTTQDQLEELLNRPLADMQLQALLTARRILSRLSSDAVCWHVWIRYVKNYPSKLYSENRMNELLEIFWCMLEGARVTDTNRLWSMIISIVYDLVLCLRKLKDEECPILNSDTLHLSLQLVCDTNTFHLVNLNKNRVTEWRISRHGGTMINPMGTIYNLVTILCDRPELVTPEIKNCLHQFVKRDGRDEFGCNLLLHACNQNLNADTLAVISLLLEVGADPNSKKNDGDSSLHRMAQLMESQFNLNSHHLPIAHLLLEYGAHFDQVNKLQQTPLDYWKWRHGKIKGKNYSPPEWMSIVPPLACWCARTIRRSKAPYDHLPENLLKFVSMH